MLIVYCAPGGLAQRMVLLRFSQAQRNSLLELKTKLVDNCMQFAYGPHSPSSIPSIGQDFQCMYGYAQEHHTVDLWLHLWHAHAKDISLHETPPPCDKLVDIVTITWNNFMGYVDTLREVVK